LINHKHSATTVYFFLVRQARKTEFYQKYGIPDNSEGRFEMILLHVILLFRFLRGSRDASMFRDQVFDVFIADLDRSLRDMGIPDTSVGRRVREMARNFYGRAKAYDEALDGQKELKDVVHRNLFGTVNPTDYHLSSMVRYILVSENFLKKFDFKQIETIYTAFPDISSAIKLQDIDASDA